MKQLQEIQKKAHQLRMDAIRSAYESPSRFGHLGGALSCAEIIALLYYDEMRLDPKNPGWDGRDRFIMSKGHSCGIQYAALADLGYFDPGHLKTYKTPHSILQGHPDCTKCPGIEATTGSLGQGLSIALGMALAARKDRKTHRVYVLLGESELQSGMTWEAAMAAGHYNPGNLICFIDRNNLQVCGRCDNVMSVEPIQDRFRAFGWEAVRVDGHNLEQLCAGVQMARHSPKPMAIVCDTVKGKGVSFMENVMEWHACLVETEDYHRAMAELQQRYDSL